MSKMPDDLDVQALSYYASIQTGTEEIIAAFAEKQDHQNFFESFATVRKVRPWTHLLLRTNIHIRLFKNVLGNPLKISPTRRHRVNITRLLLLARKFTFLVATTASQTISTSCTVLTRRHVSGRKKFPINAVANHQFCRVILPLRTARRSTSLAVKIWKIRFWTTRTPLTLVRCHSLLY